MVETGSLLVRPKMNRHRLLVRMTAPPMSMRCIFENWLECLTVLPRGNRITPIPKAVRAIIARNRSNHLQEASPRSNRPPLRMTGMYSIVWDERFDRVLLAQSGHRCLQDDTKRVTDPGNETDHSDGTLLLGLVRVKMYDQMADGLQVETQLSDMCGSWRMESC